MKTHRRNEPSRSFASKIEMNHHTNTIGMSIPGGKRERRPRCPNIQDPEARLAFAKKMLIDELIKKIKYFLPRDVEREGIARAGYERTIKEHTYEGRFMEIFSKIGLS